MSPVLKYLDPSYGQGEERDPSSERDVTGKDHIPYPHPVFALETKSQRPASNPYVQDLKISPAHASD